MAAWTGSERRGAVALCAPVQAGPVAPCVWRCLLLAASTVTQVVEARLFPGPPFLGSLAASQLVSSLSCWSGVPSATLTKARRQGDLLPFVLCHLSFLLCFRLGVWPRPSTDRSLGSIPGSNTESDRRSVNPSLQSRNGEAGSE